MIPFLENRKGFLVSKNVLCFQRIFGTYYQMSISWFLIDMKFISKLLLILLMEKYHFSILIFTKYDRNDVLENKLKKQRIRLSRNRTFFKSPSSQIWKIIFSQDAPTYFLIFVEVFWYNKSIWLRVQIWPFIGSRFNEIFEVPEII